MDFRSEHRKLNVLPVNGGVRITLCVHAPNHRLQIHMSDNCINRLSVEMGPDAADVYRPDFPGTDLFLEIFGFRAGSSPS